MKRFISYTIFSFFLLVGVSSYAQDTIVVKTANVDLRIPDKERIEKFRNDKNFQYKSEQPTRMPLWLQKILRGINEFLGKSLSKIFSREVAIIFLILVVSAIIIFIVLRSQNISFKTLFGKQKLEIDEGLFVAEDVNKMNFDELISQSLKTKNYRLAIRFMYLKNLKALSDKEIINWNPNKTNYSYQYEIENVRLRDGFLDTTRVFDFVWYGEFILGDENFQDAFNYFKEFNRMIDKQ